jgi:hypothetical protein
LEKLYGLCSSRGYRRILTDFNNLLVNYQSDSTVIKFQRIYIWLETDAKIIFDKEVPLKVQTSSRDISKGKKLI